MSLGPYLISYKAIPAAVFQIPSNTKRQRWFDHNSCLVKFAGRKFPQVILHNFNTLQFATTKISLYYL
ncbi:hypothetical protein LENED_007813 [Lentinula edodes]|uniref:Uncharacterized protein n=1 Tax=Lentinula edodes TaxID=5353 RepID=A0A1Q3EFF1_LENED|nr:hypothetical protein LENED_007813 [Lentinula edodes]